MLAGDTQDSTEYLEMKRDMRSFIIEAVAQGYQTQAIQTPSLSPRVHRNQFLEQTVVESETDLSRLITAAVAHAFQTQVPETLLHENEEKTHDFDTWDTLKTTKSEQTPQPQEADSAEIGHITEPEADQIVEAQNHVAPAFQSGEESAAVSKLFDHFGTHHVFEEIPIFNGAYPCGWISRVERFFRQNHYLNEEKIRLAKLKLEGEALTWFTHVSFTTWKDFKDKLLVRFGNISPQTPLIQTYGSDITGDKNSMHESEATRTVVSTTTESELENFVSLHVTNVPEETPESKKIGQDDYASVVVKLTQELPELQKEIPFYLEAHHMFDELPLRRTKEQRRQVLLEKLRKRVKASVWFKKIKVRIKWNANLELLEKIVGADFTLLQEGERGVSKAGQFISESDSAVRVKILELIQYVAMMFSWVAGHVEDHDLHSLNYLHRGAAKTWYCVPQDVAGDFEEMVRVHGYGEELNLLVTFSTLGEKTTVMSPAVFLKAGIPCCRLVQNPGELVVTLPRGYHSGFSHGFNFGEASNNATPEWLRMAKDTAIRRAAIHYPPNTNSDFAVALGSKVPTSINSKPQSSRLKDKKRSEGERLTKRRFVQNIIHNNKLLSSLRKGSLVALLPQSFSDISAWSDLRIGSHLKTNQENPIQLKSEDLSSDSVMVCLSNSFKDTVSVKEKFTSLCKRNRIYLASREKETQDILSDAETKEIEGAVGLSDQRLFSCVTCEVLSFDCVAIVQPKEAAARYLMSADCSFFNDWTVASGSTNLRLDAPIAEGETKRYDQGGSCAFEASLMYTDDKEEARDGQSSDFNSRRLAGGKEKEVKTLEVEQQLRPIGGINIMLIGHPDAVFNGQGVQEAALNNAAKVFVKELKLSINVIQEGPVQVSSGGKSKLRTLRSQLDLFDKEWCSFLNSFVIWKVKDARLLKVDLVRAACQLELSMTQKCKLTPGGDDTRLTQDEGASQIGVNRTLAFHSMNSLVSQSAIVGYSKGQNVMVVKPERVVRAHDGPAYDVKFYGEDEDVLLLSWGDDGTVRSWKWKKFAESEALLGQPLEDFLLSGKVIGYVSRSGIMAAHMSDDRDDTGRLYINGKRLCNNCNSFSFYSELANERETALGNVYFIIDGRREDEEIMSYVIGVINGNDPPATEESLLRIKSVHETELLSYSDDSRKKSCPSAEEALKHLLCAAAGKPERDATSDQIWIPNEEKEGVISSCVLFDEDMLLGLNLSVLVHRSKSDNDQRRDKLFHFSSSAFGVGTKLPKDWMFKFKSILFLKLATLRNKYKVKNKLLTLELGGKLFFKGGGSIDTLLKVHFRRHGKNKGSFDDLAEEIESNEASITAGQEDKQEGNSLIGKTTT